MELAERTAKWLNMPRQATVTDRKIVIYTEPETDFWQDTYYGFQRKQRSCTLVDSDEKTTFSVKKQRVKAAIHMTIAEYWSILMKKLGKAVP